MQVRPYNTPTPHACCPTPHPPFFRATLGRRQRAQKKLFLDSMVNRGSTAQALALDADKVRVDTKWVVGGLWCLEGTPSADIQARQCPSCRRCVY